MALILCHSPKGGAGTTFLAAHLAMGLSDMGAAAGLDGDVTLLTLSPCDLTPLHFALPPAQRLPSLSAPAEDAVLVSGIDLRCEPRAGDDIGFVAMLEDAGYLAAQSGRTLIVDVPAGEREIAHRLMPHAAVHVCVLTASPDCLALLPQVMEESEGREARQTAYVIGQIDETRRLSRHVAAFMREVLGEKLIAKIRQDQSVLESLAMLQTLARYAPASAALADVRQTAQTISGLLTAAIRAQNGTAGEDASSHAGNAAPNASRAA